MSKTLQENLVKLGYGDIVGSIDGIVGKKTTKAVEKFQTDFDLEVDGIAGTKTKAMITKRKGLAGTKGTRNFDIDEFRSPDNNSLPSKGMNDDLLLNLELLRWMLGNKPVIINSGYRTKAFNARVGGISNSNHLTGKAADIKVVGVSPSTVHSKAVQIFNGVGKYINFTHVDTDSKKVHFIGKY